MVEQNGRESWIAVYGRQVVGPQFFQARIFEIERWERAADIFAAGIAIWLPWSTTLTWIFIGLWLIAVIPILTGSGLRGVVATPAGGLPILLCLLAVIGMLWAVGVPMADRWGGLASVLKLLVIPLLMFQFARTGRAAWVLTGFLGSCVLLLILSWAIVLVPSLPIHWTQREGFGVPVKDYIAQTGEFAICFFLMADMVPRAWRQQQRAFALALSFAALLFLANLFAISTSRTGLVVVPTLLLLFMRRHISGWQLAAALLGGLAVGISAGILTPNVRASVTNLVNEVRTYNPADIEGTRAGVRLEFWRKSIGFIVDAPILGHGTGSILDQFRRAAAGQSGLSTMTSKNPHNQVFGVAIQLGLVGTTVLIAIWIAHLMLFRGEGLAAWAGLLVVAENIVSSLFNSHLFDFTQGWGYALGVGVAAGSIRRHAWRRGEASHFEPGQAGRSEVKIPT